MTIKRVIKHGDLDAVKEQKKMEKKIDDALQRNCLICEQPMKFIGEFVWYCKRCDTTTVVSHLISFPRTERKREHQDRFIEY